MLASSTHTQSLPPLYDFNVDSLAREFGYCKIRQWINWDYVDKYPKLKSHITPLIERVASGEFLKPTDLEPPPTFWRSITGIGSNQQGLVSKIIHQSVMNLKVQNPPRTLTPDYSPTPATDIPLYISNWTSSYRHYVTQLASQLPPINPNCRTIVAIPAAAHEEGEHVIDTLKAFKNQTESSHLYELALFLNCPAECTPEEAEKAAILSKMVDSYMQENPTQSIVCMRGSLSGRRIQSIGFIRSILADALLLRSSCSIPTTDVILLSCDADTRGVTDRYIENFRRCFDASPYTDAFVGRLRWSPEHTFSSPLSFVNQRLAELASLIKLNLSALPCVEGPVFAIRSSVFAAVGGYSFHDEIGEIFSLGERALQFRKGSTKYVARDDAGPASRLYTSSRRADAALHLKVPLYNQWGKFETAFGLSNPAIRSPTPSQSLAPEIVDIEVLKVGLEDIINKSIAAFAIDRSCNSTELVEKLIHAGVEQFLGITLSIESSGQVKVQSISKFLNSFEEYRQNGFVRWRNSLSR